MFYSWSDARQWWSWEENSGSLSCFTGNEDSFYLPFAKEMEKSLESIVLDLYMK